MIDFDAHGTTAKGFLALPPTGRGPGVVLLHAWWGLTPVFTEAATRLAQAGFVVFAPDMYQGVTAATIAEAETAMKQSDKAAIGAIVPGAINMLAAHPAVTSDRIGLVGFSMGAAWAFSMKEHVAAVVVYYGAGDKDDITADAAYQGHFAEDDPYEDAEYIQSIEDMLIDNGREVEFFTYPGTHHWFFESDRPEYYVPGAADLAWERTIAFLKRHLTAA